jgi:hypothetical protein
MSCLSAGTKNVVHQRLDGTLVTGPALLMLRPDEKTAWDGFFASEPNFAGENILSALPGPDPPDVLCTTQSRRCIGVELTKWVEHDQISSGKAREALERGYLRIVASENESCPDRIGMVWLHPKGRRIRPEHEAQFRAELFEFLAGENGNPHAEWNNPQGAPVSSFAGYPMLAKYLTGMWVRPGHRPRGLEWVTFKEPGGAYTPKWMVQAALDRIYAKIEDYEDRNLHSLHSLNELHLLCYYSDEALLYNTPTHAPGFDFTKVAGTVAEALAVDNGVFDKIFLSNPYEKCKVMQVFPRGSR